MSSLVVKAAFAGLALLRGLDAVLISPYEEHPWTKSGVSPFLKQHHLQQDIKMIPSPHFTRIRFNAPNAGQSSFPHQSWQGRKRPRMHLTPTYVHGPPKEELESVLPVHEVKAEEEASPSQSIQSGQSKKHIIRLSIKKHHVQTGSPPDEQPGPSSAMNSKGDALSARGDWQKRPDRLKAYAWQRRLGSQELYKVYKIMALEWGELSRSSNYDAIKRLSSFLEDRSDILEGILKNDKDAIQLAKSQSEPKYQKTDLQKQPIDEMLRMLFAPSTLKGHGPKTYKKPRWAPQKSTFGERERLVSNLIKLWGVQDGTVRSRLYFAGSASIEKYFRILLGSDPDKARTASMLLLEDVEKNMHQYNQRAYTVGTKEGEQEEFLGKGRGRKRQRRLKPAPPT